MLEVKEFIMSVGVLKTIERLKCVNVCEHGFKWATSVSLETVGHWRPMHVSICALWGEQVQVCVFSTRHSLRHPVTSGRMGWLSCMQYWHPVCVWVMKRDKTWQRGTESVSKKPEFRMSLYDPATLHSAFTLRSHYNTSSYHTSLNKIQRNQSMVVSIHVR